MSFRALAVIKHDQGLAEAFADFDDNQLLDGDVDVRVTHSTVNYKDGVLYFEIHDKIECGIAQLLRRDEARRARELRRNTGHARKPEIDHLDVGQIVGDHADRRLDTVGQLAPVSVWVVRHE